MLNPCPAALHLLALTKKCPACKAAEDYREESGIRRNLPGFGRLVQKTFAGTAISVGWGGVSFCNIFYAGKTPALTHLYPHICTVASPAYSPRRLVGAIKLS